MKLLCLIPLFLLIVTGCSSAPVHHEQAPPEELWIIQRSQPPSTQPIPAAASVHGDFGQIPLTHTSVHARLTGQLSTVDLIHQFRNPHNTAISAMFTFSLPPDSSITDFIMTIGQRRIRGIIRDRRDALRIYDQARAQGYTASFLDSITFRQHLANIQPGKQIDISIRYHHNLAYADGWYEFIFPMRSGDLPDRAGRDISLAVDIDAGVPLNHVQSPSHQVQISTPQPAKAQVQLIAADRIPNEDFVLRLQPAPGQRLPSPKPATLSPGSFIAVDATGNK